MAQTATACPVTQAMRARNLAGQHGYPPLTAKQPSPDLDLQAVENALLSYCATEKGADPAGDERHGLFFAEVLSAYDKARLYLQANPTAQPAAGFVAALDTQVGPRISDAYRARHTHMKDLRDVEWESLLEFALMDYGDV